MRVPQTRAVVAALLLVGVLTGCPRTGKVSTGTGGAGSSIETPPEELLNSAISQLRPENYTISAATDKPINLLNTWSGRTSDAQPKFDPPVLPAGWITDEEAKRLTASEYDLRDAIHIRDAILNHAITVYLASRGSDELGQVQAIFDFVIRNIALRSADETDLPLGVYQLLLLGRGNADDRAWVCAALLKQLRIDCVVVQPSGNQDDAWLLGVILNGKVYLFDTLRGIALPSSDDVSRIGSRPATLDEIVAHPEWLSLLAVRADQPYPIDAESLKQPALHPIVEADYWNGRMKRLEAALPANEVCVLYDAPADETGGQPGILSRLKATFPNADPEKMTPWSYPARQMTLSRTPNPALKQAWDQATQTFNLPIPLIIDKEKNTATLGNPERRMLRIRTDQLLGKFEDVTQRYLSIRHLEIEPMPIQELTLLNRMGAENAIYWTGVSKFESREYAAAIEQLSGYLKRYERSGKWSFAARSLLADCHAELGQFAEAVAVLERTRSDDPYRAANAIRAKKWAARK